MDELDFFAIPSPCIGVCKVYFFFFFYGCLRSREERLYWLQMNDDQKHQVMRLIAMRRKKWDQVLWERNQLPEDEPQQEGLDFD